jgi:UDP-glucuronate 4-epimerase
MKKVLITGAAGFIGYHTTKRLASEGIEVVGLDNLCSGVSFELKTGRLELLKGLEGFRFIQGDIADADALKALLKQEKFDAVLHLAAQPGVRESFVQPERCIQANVVGFGNMLEAARMVELPHLVYASSSSVYGLNEEMPWSTHAGTNHPASLYAATKKANELMAHSYSHVYKLPTTGLRFFTVYGPWGRPDMAPMLFAKAIIEGKPIQIFNYGQAQRDFTYVDDIVRGIRQILLEVPQSNSDWDSHRADPADSSAPYAVYNIGKGQPEELMVFVELLEKALGRQAEKIMMPMQPGDVVATYAEIDPLFESGPYKPVVSLEEGIPLFADWFLSRYGAIATA